MSVDAEEPFAQQIAIASDVANDPEATEKEQRSALATIKRLRGRRQDLGVSAFDFAKIDGRALRIYYSAETLRPTPDEDNTLVQFFASLAADVEVLARLLGRAHCLLKTNTEPNAYRPEGSVSFHFMRPSKFNKTKLPFETGDKVTLFDDMDGRPVFRGVIVSILIADEQTNPASGALAIQLTPIDTLN